MMEDSNMSAEMMRDRSRRTEKGGNFSGGSVDGGSKSSVRDRSTTRTSKRVYVSNIPYEYRWQDLKDLFRRIVGPVDFVELFVDESYKPRGCGIVEFKELESVQKCIDKMHRHELNGREIIVKEDHGEERDKFGRIGRGGGSNHGGAGGDSGRGGGGGGGGGGNSGGSARGQSSGGNQRDRDMDRGFMMNRGDIGGGGGGNNFIMNKNRDYDSPSNYNTYGLSTSFLNNLGIQGPLHTKVFIANLDYKVDAKKLKEVFKLAGRIVHIDLATDKDGNSRGFAVVDYEHPVEAVQAISMFDRQVLFDRRMTVRLDRVPDKNEKIKLPEGLISIGMGLGQNGEPLRNVALNLPNMTMSQQNVPCQSNMNNAISNSAPVPVAPPTGSANMLGSVQNTNNLTENLAALNSVVGSLTNLGALSNNPLLSSAAASLNSLGLNLGVPSANTDHGNVSNTANVPAFQQSNQQSLQNSYNPAFGGNTNYNTNSRNNDYDGGQQLRNYNTQPQDDFSRNSSSFNNGMAQVLGQQLGGNVGGGGGRCSDTILIRNLPPSCTWQTLRDKFRDVGEVKFAEIRGQDCGVVRFSKERDAELALKIMDGARFDGRNVDVTYL